MPWKNGLGATTELAIGPAGATLAGPFDWRLSIAELKVSGPFSQLPGIERIIAQLEGPPMRLEHDSGDSRALALLTPYRFQGEWATSATLSGPARDFNVMAARAKLSPAVSVHHMRGGSRVSTLTRASVTAIYGLSGKIGVTVQGSPSSWAVATGELLLIEAPGGADVEAAVAAETDAVALLVVLSPKA